MLNLPLETVKWSTRDFKGNQHRFDIHRRLEDGENIILVDDINDSGRTFIELKADWDYTNTLKGKLTTVSVLQRHSTTEPSNEYGFEVRSEDWVVFPWELD